MIGKEVLISKINTMADGTIRVQVDFNELTPLEIATLFELKSKGTTGALFVETEALQDFKQAITDIQKLKEEDDYSN